MEDWKQSTVAIVAAIFDLVIFIFVDPRAERGIGELKQAPS